MPVKQCPNGKWRFGSGPCVYDTRAKALEAQRAYYANKGVSKMPVRLKNIAISFISLVKAGANKRKLIVKTVDGEPTIEFEAKIRKIDEEGRRFYSIVYPAGEEDTQGEFAKAEDIQEAAYRFMKGLNALNVDKDHSFVAEEAYVAESWLIRKDDPLFPEEPEGSWAVAIIVEDDELWEQVKKGEIEAISMGGTADKIEETIKALDYDEATLTSNFWEVLSPLETSIRSIMEDEGIEDKKTAIGDSIDQFKAKITEMVKSKEKGSFIEGLKKTLDVILNKSKQKGGNSDMKKEEVQQMIDDAIKKAFEEAPKPLTKEEMAEIVKESLKPTVERVEAIEKTSNGSKQGDEEITKDEDLDKIGHDIAKMVNG